MVFVSVKDSSQYFIENKCSCLLWLFIPSKNNKQGHHAHSNAFGLRFAFCKTKTKKSSICMRNHEHQWEVKQIWRESRTSDRYSGFATSLRAQRSPSSALNLLTYQWISICFFFKPGGKVDEWWKSLDFHHEETKPSEFKKGPFILGAQQTKTQVSWTPCIPILRAEARVPWAEASIKIELVPPGDDTST